MKKNLFEVFTKKDFSFIPSDVAVIKNKYGWTFIVVTEAQVYVNSTNSGANCDEKENEIWLKRITKKLKEQMKEVKGK